MACCQSFWNFMSTHWLVFESRLGQSTIFHRSCSHSVHRLTSVGALARLITGSLCFLHKASTLLLGLRGRGSRPLDGIFHFVMPGCSYGGYLLQWTTAHLSSTLVFSRVRYVQVVKTVNTIKTSVKMLCENSDCIINQNKTNRRFNNFFPYNILRVLASLIMYFLSICGNYHLSTCASPGVTPSVMHISWLILPPPGARAQAKHLL